MNNSEINFEKKIYTKCDIKLDCGICAMKRQFDRKRQFFEAWQEMLLIATSILVCV